HGRAGARRAVRPRRDRRGGVPAPAGDAAHRCAPVRQFLRYPSPLEEADVSVPRSFGRIRRTSGRGLIVALVLIVASVGAPRAAWAHGEGDSDQALILVRQAIAYLVNTPINMDAAADKIRDATEAPDKDGVRIPLVEQARDAMEAGDMESGALHRARALREQAIGAHVHPGNAAPVAIGDVPPLVTGADTGTLAALDPMPGRGGLNGGD